MKRELKFRFVNKHRETFKISVYERTLLEIEDNDSWQGASPWERLAVYQFTGLKDRNGTEIYEGDILKCERSYWDDYRNLVVTWQDESAGFFLEDQLDTVNSESLSKQSMFCVPENEREVIGNIYENPELLEAR